MIHNNPQSMVTILSDTDSTISHIYHFSDIHIRKNDRHDEYREIFASLYNMISESIRKNIKKKKGSLIICTGDVFHEGLSCDAITLTKELFISLANLCDIIVIYGNHDCVCRNNDEKNILYPILSNLKTTNKIHLLERSRIYQYENILFYHMGMFDQTLLSPIQDDSKIHIALYHGIVQGCKNANNMVLSTSKNYRPVDFCNFSYVLLGDIHMYQDLSIEGTTICYASSLIQQSFGEGIANHGYVHYNLDVDAYEYKHVPNKYGFVTITVKDDKYVLPRSFPAKTNLRIKQRDSSDSVVRAMHAKVATLTEIISFCSEKVFSDYGKIGGGSGSSSGSSSGSGSDSGSSSSSNSGDSNSDSDSGSNSSTDSSNDGRDDSDDNCDDAPRKKKKFANKPAESIEIKSDDMALTRFMNYIATTPDDPVTVSITPDTQQVIRAKLTATMKKINYNYTTNENALSLISLSFDNFNVYQESNYIDFTSISMIQNISGDNGIGKSSIIYCILFAFYGDNFENIKRCDYINSNKHHLRTKIIFTINDITYSIERIIQRKKKSANETENKIILCKNNEDISGKTLPDIEKQIKHLLGDPDKLLETCVMSPKYTGNNFLDKSDLEKYKYIASIIKMDIYSRIAQELQTDTKTLNAKIAERMDIVYKDVKTETYNDTELTKLLARCTDTITELSDNITDTENEIATLAKEKYTLDLQIKDKASKYSIKELKQMLATHTDNLESAIEMQNEINTVDPAHNSTTINSLQSKISDYRTSYISNIKMIDNKEDELNAMIDKEAVIRNAIVTLQKKHDEYTNELYDDDADTIDKYNNLYLKYQNDNAILATEIAALSKKQKALTEKYDKLIDDIDFDTLDITADDACDMDIQEIDDAIELQLRNMIPISKYNISTIENDAKKIRKDLSKITLPDDDDSDNEIPDDIEEQYAALQSAIADHDTATSELNEKIAESERYTDQLETMKDYKYNPSCSICTSNNMTKLKIEIEKKYADTLIAIQSAKKHATALSKIRTSLTKYNTLYHTHLKIQEHASLKAKLKELTNIINLDATNKAADNKIVEYRKLKLAMITQNDLSSTTVTLSTQTTQQTTNNAKIEKYQYYHDAYETNKTYDTKMKNVEKQLTTHNTDLELISLKKENLIAHNEQYNLYKDDIENNKKITENIAKCEAKIKTLEQQIAKHAKDSSECELTIAKLTKSISETTTAIENKKIETTIQTEISAITDSISTLSTTLNKYKNELFKEIENKTRYECQIATISQSKNEITTLQKDKTICTLIISIINGNFTSYYMKNYVLKKFVTQVNNILSRYVKYTIAMEYDDKKIYVYKQDDVFGSTNANKLSGYEYVMANIILKISINEFNKQLRTNFLLLDEIFSYSDTKNISKVETLFEFIKERYAWAMVISHDSQIQTYTDSTINIDHVGGYSSVRIGKNPEPEPVPDAEAGAETDDEENVPVKSKKAAPKKAVPKKAAPKKAIAKKIVVKTPVKK